MEVLQKLWAVRNYRMALIFSALLLLWLLSGIVFERKAADAAAAPTATAPSLTRVSARDISAQPYATEIVVRGRTEANRRVAVRAQTHGHVVALPVAEGSRVSTGQVICELAPEDRQLRVDEATAQLAMSQLEYDGALRLKSGGYQSKTAIAGAKARLETAKANLRQSELREEGLRVLAPFDGILDERVAEVGDLMQRADICATVLDLDPLVVSGRISEADVNRIEPHARAEARLAGGDILSGKVQFIARSADNITRTFRIEAQVSNPDWQVRSGLSADMRIPTGNVPAHLISASVLMLDDAGGVGVRILDSEDRVSFAPVTLIGDHADGVWVAGLPQQTRLITVGQEYVYSGETVAVVLEEPVDAVAEQSDAEAAEQPAVPESAPEAQAAEQTPPLDQIDTELSAAQR